MTAIASPRAADTGTGLAAAAATALAIPAVLGSYGLARLARDDLIVTAPGRPAGPIPVIAAEHTSTALWQCAMHVAAAAALIRLITRTLPIGGTK